MIKISGFPFNKICQIIPELNEDGLPKEYKPQAEYKNNKNISLHKYGYGPFCRFKIPSEYNGKIGVYVIKVGDQIKYVGECEDLGKRFNMGYGVISPRNCYKGGQSTNCRINNLILQMFKNRLSISK